MQTWDGAGDSPVCKVLLCKKSATASSGAGDSSRGSWEHLPPLPRERGRGFRCSRARGTDPRVGATVLSPGIKAALSGAGDGVTHPRGVHPRGGSACCAPHKDPGRGDLLCPGLGHGAGRRGGSQPQRTPAGCDAATRVVAQRRGQRWPGPSCGEDRAGQGWAGRNCL